MILKTNEDLYFPTVSKNIVIDLTYTVKIKEIYFRKKMFAKIILLF